MNVQIRRIIVQQTRNYSYKPVKRVKFPPAGSSVLKLDRNSNVPSLKNELKSRIFATGPISIATYMKQVLTNPVAGYYMTSENVFGSRGDFVTSPEIGQIFGEMVAVWCLNELSKFGSVTPCQLIELGPGKGTMMRDILRVFDQFKACDGLSVHLVEMSEHLSKTQAELLCRSSTEYSDKPFYRSGITPSGMKIYWYRQLNDVPQCFSIILAHEFFDALPIHKFSKQEDGWKEVLIDIDPKNGEKFRFILSKSETPMLRLFLNHYPTLVKEREHIEVSFDSETIVRQIGQRFHTNGGFALVVDYGHSGEKGDTFRAFKNHQLHDPLDEPGNADLTADVDFSILSHFCGNTSQIAIVGPTSQRSFMELVGAKERLRVLLKSAGSEEEKYRLVDGFKMLTDPEQMGERFKFFALFPKELETFIKCKR
ncbi:protein arginine methyltransferase NDUFAF7, mitochondrial [Toxorhynchites rutilus septentrionalis]|uniref:protein arginine methyltransferase NDUFAF7, mitochondrial n=1 Tax=Toxorhynchites rutilus septentrionalis TaxID=329112 RepID=UPI00247A97AC|nr:protein arginine methyltransferase NDUFAF7, mitochondrial [Toxorhynchites rutilus septentrionalis]